MMAPVSQILRRNHGQSLSAGSRLTRRGTGRSRQNAPRTSGIFKASLWRAATARPFKTWRSSKRLGATQSPKVDNEFARRHKEDGSPPRPESRRPFRRNCKSLAAAEDAPSPSLLVLAPEYGCGRTDWPLARWRLGRGRRTKLRALQSASHGERLHTPIAGERYSPGVDGRDKHTAVRLSKNGLSLHETPQPQRVMPALVAGIHAMKPAQPTTICRCGAAWMAGTSPAMTVAGHRLCPTI
jgi:hypothetical protein